MVYFTMVNEKLPPEFKMKNAADISAMDEVTKAKYVAAWLSACAELPGPDKFWDRSVSGCCKLCSLFELCRVTSFLFGQQKRARFKLFASVLQLVLPIPATNVVAESLFSHSSFVLSKRRHKLTAARLESLTILHYEGWSIVDAVARRNLVVPPSSSEDDDDVADADADL